MSTTTQKAIKPKSCKSCGSKFQPTRQLMTARVCGPLCGLELARADRERKQQRIAADDRREDRAKRERMKSMGTLIAEAQTAFNAFIRERDRLAGHACISSSRQLDWTGNAIDAGHYRSRGSAPHLRFDERNCHAQSKQENRYASGNATGYRLGLIARIGLEAVEALECDQTPRKYSRDELIAIKTTYAAKARALKKEPQ